MVHFINSLSTDLSAEKLAELDEAMGLSSTKNAEIGRTWFIQVAQRRHQPAYPQLSQYLRSYGRTRLVRPIYEALANNGSDLELARQLFADAQSDYHPATSSSIETRLQRAEQGQ